MACADGVSDGGRPTSGHRWREHGARRTARGGARKRHSGIMADPRTAPKHGLPRTAAEDEHTLTLRPRCALATSLATWPPPPPVPRCPHAAPTAATDRPLPLLPEGPARVADRTPGTAKTAICGFYSLLRGPSYRALMTCVIEWQRLTPPFVFFLFGTLCPRQRSVGLEGAGGLREVETGNSAPFVQCNCMLCLQPLGTSLRARASGVQYFVGVYVTIGDASVRSVVDL